jgi:hypothetical protein
MTRSIHRQLLDDQSRVSGANRRPTEAIDGRWCVLV